MGIYINSLFLKNPDSENEQNTDPKNKEQFFFSILVYKMSGILDLVKGTVSNVGSYVEQEWSQSYSSKYRYTLVLYSIYYLPMNSLVLLKSNLPA